MALPQPETGLIVHYSYQFLQRTKTIGDAGKERPCLIAAVFLDREDHLKAGVLYLPITHTQPGAEETAIELPPNVCYAAGLDGFRQWLLVSQGNADTWPEDIFNLPNQPGIFHYGFLPPGFFKTVQMAFGRLYAAQKFNIVSRNNPEL